MGIGNLLLTALLVVLAWAAWKRLAASGANRRSEVEEAARRTTESRVAMKEAGTLRQRDGSDVYEVEPAARGGAEKGGPGA